MYRLEVHRVGVPVQDPHDMDMIRMTWRCWPRTSNPSTSPAERMLIDPQDGRWPVGQVLN
jgi:hypothetical protein